MQKLSPLMKGLVETRARADDECAKLTSLLNDLTTKLHRAKAERNSCDQLITKLNSQIQPDQINPVQAWQGRYGKRGALKHAILQALKDAHPLELTTTTIAGLLQHSFSLQFITPLQRKNWVRNTVNSGLKTLLNANLIQRTHNPKVNSGGPGTWQWLPPDQAFANLQTIAAHAGLTTTFALDQDPLETDNLTCEPTPDEDNLPR